MYKKILTDSKIFWILIKIQITRTDYVKKKKMNRLILWGKNT